MPCHRIRFEREEIDLRLGTTVIGRDESCAITLHDPQVSRLHAMILVDETSAVLRDLGSRNGTRVNGATIHSETVLHDGDQVSLAERPFLYCCIDDTSAHESTRRTTERRLRIDPEAPFSGEARLQTPTVEMDRRAWWMQLQLDLLEKAVATTRYELADQIFERIVSSCDGRRDDGPEFFSSREFDALIERVARQLVGRGSGAWLGWILDRLRAAGRLPTPALVAIMSTLPLPILHDASAALDAMLHHWSERSERLDAHDATMLSALLSAATDVRLSGERHVAVAYGIESPGQSVHADTFEEGDGPLTLRRRTS